MRPLPSLQASGRERITAAWDEKTGLAPLLVSGLQGVTLSLLTDHGYGHNRFYRRLGTHLNAKRKTSTFKGTMTRSDQQGDAS